MQLDFSRDWMVFDNLESVTLRSVRNSGDVVDTLLAGVLREEMTVRDVVNSRGAYAPGDCWFCLPAMLLKNGPPKPGDLLIDLADNAFTLLETPGRLRDGSGQYQEYRCRGRNKVLAFDLADSITIQTPTYTLDSSGAEVRTPWMPLYIALKAKAIKLTDETADLFTVRGMKGTYQVLVEQEIAVTNKERVVWAGAPSGYLEILRYHPAANLENVPILDCEAMPV